jgi:hypothetical protein
MPRPKQFDRPVKWTLNIPQSTVTAVEGILHDPLFNKPLYAARGKIINQLLLEFISDIQEGRRTFDPISQRISTRHRGNQS